MSRFGLMKAEMLHRDGAQRHRCKPIILRLVQFTAATMFQHVDLTFMGKQGSGGELATNAWKSGCFERRMHGRTVSFPNHLQAAKDSSRGIPFSVVPNLEIPRILQVLKRNPSPAEAATKLLLAALLPPNHGPTA